MNDIALMFLPAKDREAMVAARRKGMLFCPCCKLTYAPKYPRKEMAPEGTIYREQHISGICSDECWDKYL